jgi:hypothetical protein
MKQGDNMAAVAIEVGEQAKWDSYLKGAAKLPKRDRRELSHASEQTRWIIEATRDWYAFYRSHTSGMGLPTETALHRAGLMLPRAPFNGGLPTMADPPRKAASVEAALPQIRESRRRVLIACERYAEQGLARAARQLGMSESSTTDYLKEARQSLADILRGMGWDVPLAK